MDAETFEAIVERLRKQGTDDGEFEVKESAAKLSSDIWETVSAFANTTGGVIILGLSERNDFTPVDNFDRAAVEGASEADFGKTLIARTFDRAYDLAPRSMKGADNNWERLERLNFIDEKGHVTKAGLLAAGSYPQQFFPRLVVDVEVHPGLEKGTPGAPRFTDRTVCEGTIGEMVADAVAAIAKNLHRRSIVVGASRIDELEIPEEVIREAVANALVHRDYSPPLRRPGGLDRHLRRQIRDPEPRGPLRHKDAREPRRRRLLLPQRNAHEADEPGAPPRGSRIARRRQRLRRADDDPRMRAARHPSA